RSSWAKIFSMLLLTRYLLITFGYGQVNLALLAGLSLLSTNLSSRWKGFVWASVSVIKIYPLVFGLGFLLQKAKAVLLSAMISLFLFSLIPLFYLWKSPFFLYEEFLRSLESKGFPLHSHNQSISALLQRAFTDQEFPLHAVGVEKWAFLQLDIGFVKIIAFLVGALLSGSIWWLAFKKNKEKHNFEYYLAAGSFSVLFLSHIVWKDYLLFLFFPLAQIFKDQTPKHLKTLAVLSLLFVTLFSSPDVMGAPLGTRLDAACIHLWGALFIALIWAKTLMRIEIK
ncbi:MAG: glycosyltransferase 87 family protein, partial [Oligoflexia bacterium]|nr:glycosyltransferase 87 family protein [Oligoflexia bacterium]